MINAAVLFKKAVSKIGYKKAVAVTAFKKAVAVTAFKKAVATTAFKKAIATINIGDFFIFRFFFDVLGITDTQAKDMGKTLSDSQSISDSAFTGVDKVLADASITADNVSFGFGQKLIDSAGLSDSIDKIDTNKAIQENPLVTESASFAIGMQRIDVFSVGESIAIDAFKPFDDSFYVSDVQLMQLDKALSDNSNFTDSNFLSSGKALFDYPVIVEDQNMAFHKVINEVAGVTDDLDGEATANDDQSMTFTKVKSEVALISDLLSRSTMSQFGDTIGSSDAGSLRGQGYCAFDYFDSDYVGYSQTF